MVEEIRKIIEGEVLEEEKVLEEFSEDKSIFKIKPNIVIFPKSVSDIKNLVKFVAQKKKEGVDVSLTSRSAGTDMTGGPLTSSILLVFTKYFNKILSWEEDSVTLEPGVYYRDFEKEADKRGLFFPSYPASKDICAFGGIVNNNSGGEKSLKYGKTENYVLEMEVVLADGEAYLIKEWSRNELESIKSKKNFLAEAVFELEKLIKENYELIQSKKPIVHKNSSGYNLWDVWDKNKDTFNLVKLFVGAQGTLGIMTKAKIKLLKKKKFEGLIVIFLKKLNELPKILNKILALDPVSIEATDDHTFKIYLRYAKDMVKLLGAEGSLFQVAKLFWPETKYILFHGLPKLILLVSFESDDENEIKEKLVKTKELIEKEGLWYRIPESKIEENKYWKLRRDTFKLLRERVKGKFASPILDDIVILPEKLPEFLPKLYEILDKYKLLYTISGHIGEGNFHIIPLMDLKKEKEKIYPAMDEAYKLVVDYQGSISGEHNDGLLRTPYLEMQFGKEMAELFRKVKEIFDPLCIFNPFKKVGLRKEEAIKFIRES